MIEAKGTVKLRGKIHIKCLHTDGRIETREIDNIIVAAGKAQVAGLIGIATYVPFTALAIGTGTATAATTDTALGTELTTGGFTRVVATVSRVTTDDANDTCQLVASWTSSSAATVAVTEVGAFNSITIAGSVMLGRQTFAAINMTSGDALEATYRFDVD